MRTTHVPLIREWAPTTLNHGGSRLICRRGGDWLLTSWDIAQARPVRNIGRVTQNEVLGDSGVSPVDSKVFGVVKIVPDDGSASHYELRIWDRETLTEEFASIVAHQQQTDLQSSTASESSTGATLTLYDPNLGTVLKTVHLPRSLKPNAACVSEDGILFAGVNSMNQSIEFCDVDAGDQLLTRSNYGFGG